MDAPKKKAPQVAAGGAFTKKHSKPKFSEKGTRMEAQMERIIAALCIGLKTTDDLRKLGCYQVSARIHALRHKRHLNIVTELFNGYAADGYPHARMAHYTLLGKPEGRA